MPCITFSSVLLGAVMAAQAVAAEEPHSPLPANGESPFVCVLSCDNATVELGTMPKITVAITNRTEQDVYLVGNLDGSNGGDRYPHCVCTVTKDGKVVPVAETERWCGDMNALEDYNFVKVAAGQTFDPYQDKEIGPGQHRIYSSTMLYPSMFKSTGAYHVRFHYSTTSDDIREWAGDGRDSVGADKTLVALFRQVPHIDLTSNELVITVVMPPEISK
jgi:hypothetical protein